MRIAIDLGGTNVRVATVLPGGQVERIISEPCRSKGSEEEVLEHIFSLIDELMTP